MGVVTVEVVVVVVVEVVEGKIIGGVIICGTAVHVSSLTSPSLNCKSVSKFILKTKNKVGFKKNTRMGTSINHLLH